MSDGLTLDQFAQMTLNIAGGDDEFVPTFVNPVAQEIRALEGVPSTEDIAAIVRNWAAGFGAERYFIAYPSAELIVAEEYAGGALIASQDIRLN